MTNVARLLGSGPIRVTPKIFAIVLSVSAMRGNGKWCSSLKDFCSATVSLLTPMIATPFFVRSVLASRNAQPCVVQPGVLAFG